MAPSHPSSFRSDIQGLRAFAVLAVVLFHAHIPGFSGGYVGVDMFFVLSGFLITSLLYKEYDKTGRIDFKQFYARRIRRLLPAAALVLVVTLLVAYWLLSPIEQSLLVKPFLATALYLSNYWFADNAMAYLGEAMHTNPVLHTWSLSVEEQFYLFWPLLVLIAARWLPGKQLNHRLLFFAVGLTLLSFVFSLWLIERSQPWAFFSLPARAWEFGLGGATYLLSSQYAQRSNRLNQLLFLVGAALTIAAIALFDHRTLFPGWAALMPALGTALMLAAGTSAQPPSMMIFLNAPVLQYLGNVSYSWYLWHWPAQVFYRELRPDIGLLESFAAPIISLFLAVLTYHGLENRIRFSPTLSKTSWRSITAGVFITGLSAISVISLWATTKHSLSDPNQRAVMAAREDVPKLYADRCHLPYLSTKATGCDYALTGSDTRAILFGDSHAAQWFPAIELIAKKQGWQLAAISKSSCPAADLSVFNSALSRTYHECDQWRENLFERIDNEKPRLVLISNAANYLNSISEDEWSLALHKTLTRLQSVPRVILIDDTPWPQNDPPICLSRAYWQAKEASLCNFVNQPAKEKPFNAINHKLANEFANVEVVHLNQHICTGTQCNVITEDQIIYRDRNHITASYSRQLADAFSQQLGFGKELALNMQPAEQSAGGQ